MRKPRPAMNEAGQNCAASATDSLPRLRCPTCGNHVVPVLFWNSAHLQANCPPCNRYIKHVPQVEPWLSAAPPRIIQMGMFEDVA